VSDMGERPGSPRRASRLHRCTHGAIGDATNSSRTDLKKIYMVQLVHIPVTTRVRAIPQSGSVKDDIYTLARVSPGYCTNATNNRSRP
jgi:hypothetical protein